MLHIFCWILLTVLFICLHWISLPINEIMFCFMNFTDGLHIYSLQIGNLYKMEALQPVLQWICLKFRNSITRFYFIFIFKEDDYRWDGRNWERQEMIRETFPQLEIVILCSEGLLLVLGTAFARDLGAITHHRALEENSTAKGSRVAKKWDTAHSARLPFGEQKPAWVPEESGLGGRKTEGLLRKHSHQDGRNWGAYQEELLREKSLSQENSRNLTNVAEGGQNCSANDDV